MKKTISLTLVLALVACGPVYQTDYEFISPRTTQGGMCANTCIMMQSTCKRSCRTEATLCAVEAREDARDAYEDYVRDREKKGRKVKRDRDDFYHGDSCDTGWCEADCEADYRACFVNCGGQVIPHTYCASGCQ